MIKRHGDRVHGRNDALCNNETQDIFSAEWQHAEYSPFTIVYIRCTLIEYEPKANYTR